MKYLSIILFMLSTAAHANCVGNYVVRADGTSVYCQTCCYNGNCTTVCF